MPVLLSTDGLSSTRLCSGLVGFLTWHELKRSRSAAEDAVAALDLIQWTTLTATPSVT